MNECLISIIIPMYNSEKTIERLLKSIVNQSYKNFEVILLNDGSTDDTERLCKKFLIYENIKYIYKNNTGVSDTRNIGVKNAIGKYICFIDADDMITKDYIKDFSELIKNNDEKNILYCCKYINAKDEKIYLKTESKPIIKTKYVKKNKYNVLFDSEYRGYLWNKIFLKSIITNNNIQFKKDVYMTEDMLFVFEYLKYIKEVICIDKINYLYITNESSLSKNRCNIKWFTVFKTMDYLILNKNLYTQELYKRIVYAYLYYLYKAKNRIKFIDDREKYCTYKKMINTKIVNSKYLFYSLNIKQKIKIIIYKLFGRIIFAIKK